METDRRPGRATPLSELALVFLKLGTTAFGGPAAHIAMMEDEVVRRRRGSRVRPSSITWARPISSPDPTPLSWPFTSGTRGRDGLVSSWRAWRSSFRRR